MQGWCPSAAGHCVARDVERCLLGVHRVDAYIKADDEVAHLKAGTGVLLATAAARQLRSSAGGRPTQAACLQGPQAACLPSQARCAA